MNNASTFALLGALTGLLVTYGLMVSGEPDQGPTAPRLSFDEREAIRVAGAGTWRAPPHALSASEPGGGVVATEIVTIPAAKFQALVQKGNPVPQNGGSITIDAVGWHAWLLRRRNQRCVDHFDATSLEDVLGAGQRHTAPQPARAGSSRTRAKPR
jgi:hypothetical protein